jgi:hypothetical protein
LLGGGFCSGGCSFGGGLSGLSLFSDWLIYLGHFVYLSENPNNGQRQENDGNDFSELPPTIFALFFGTIGVTLCGYGVYQSRKIEGWSALYALAGWRAFWMASYFIWP